MTAVIGPVKFRPDGTGVVPSMFVQWIICQLEAPQGAPRHNLLGMYRAFRVE